MAQLETRKRKSISFADLQANTNDDEIKDWLEGHEIIKFDSSVKALDVRPVSPIIPVARHWPKSVKSGATCPPCYCPRYNMQTQKFDKSDNPCPLHDDFDDKAQKILVFACIVRQWQTGKKAKQNPVGIMVIPGGLQKELVSIVEINKGDLSDFNKGCDLRISFDKEVQGPQKWSIQRANTVPLTEEEREYDIPDLDAMAPDFDNPAYTAEYVKGMKSKMAKWGYYVKPLNNGKSGWEGFKKTPEGQPYTQFSELGAGSGGAYDDATPHRNDVAAAPVQARRAVVADDDMPVQRARPVDTGKVKAPVARAMDNDDAPPAASLAGDDDDDSPFVDDDDAPPPAKPAAAKKPAVKAKSGGPEEHAAWSTKHTIQWAASDKAEGEERPECFSVFAGAPKCRNCPVKNDCLTA